MLHGLLIIAPWPNLLRIITATDLEFTPMSESRSFTPSHIVPAFAPLYSAFSPLADALVRAAAGAFLVPHGAQKLFGWFGGYGLEATGQFFATKLGLPASLALVAGTIEVFGGIALALGFATRIAAALVFGLMAVAVVQVHLGLGFFWTSGGYEYPLLWAIVALSFVVKGGGRYSVDAAIGHEI
jgi:putative oxidoreductase